MSTRSRTSSAALCVCRIGTPARPPRYLGRFRHLSKLSKRATDYFIFVGLATWTVAQITPGTWTVQTGRLALRIIAIFYLSRVLIEVCALFPNEFFLTPNEQSPAEFQQRQTLVPVAASLLRYGIYFTAVVMSLREAGIDPTPLLAGAGVAGVAVGLLAQQFVGDIVAGFFVLFESLFLVGDFVEVAGVKGNIEEIGVRVTKIRDEAGVLHAVPNGEVRKVSSHSKGYVNAVSNIPVPYTDALFTVCEHHEAGTLAEDDFVRLGRAYGLSDLVALTGFKLIDRNGNGRISKEEWQRFMRDVFLSQKLNDAAAVVFGPGCRDQA